MFDWILLALGMIFIILGLLGAILPVIPGPPVSYAGLLFLHATTWVEFSTHFLIVMAVVAVVVTLVDYYVPIWGTRRLGGSPLGIRGAMAGTLIGVIIFPPLGIILGPLVGATIAELFNDHRNFRGAFRSGLGSLMGFLTGTGLKLAASGIMTWYFISAYW